MAVIAASARPRSAGAVERPMRSHSSRGSSMSCSCSRGSFSRKNLVDDTADLAGRVLALANHAVRAGRDIDGRVFFVDELRLLRELDERRAFRGGEHDGVVVDDLVRVTSDLALGQDEASL